MKSIIDEIYFGNIVPQEVKIPERDKVDKTAYEKYIDSLSDEQSEAFAKAVDYLLNTNSLTNAAMFRYGFKLGLLIGIEIYNSEE